VFILRPVSMAASDGIGEIKTTVYGEIFRMRQ
jgi:hypothetical protein